MVVYISWLLWLMLQWTPVYRLVYGPLCSVLLGVQLGVTLLGGVGTPCQTSPEELSHRAPPPAVRGASDLSASLPALVSQLFSCSHPSGVKDVLQQFWFAFPWWLQEVVLIIINVFQHKAYGCQDCRWKLCPLDLLRELLSACRLVYRCPFTSWRRRGWLRAAVLLLQN